MISAGKNIDEAASVEVAEQILSRISPGYAEIITGWIPRENCMDSTQWSQEIDMFLSNLKLEDPLEVPDLFAAIVNPDLMEIEISRSDRLDEAIDRKIKRIMQVKAAKHIFPNKRKNAKPEPKLINAAASTDGQLAVISESEPKPAEHPEIIVSAESDGKKGAFRTQSRVVIEGTRMDEGGPASVPSDVIEKGHSVIVHGSCVFCETSTDDG